MFFVVKTHVFRTAHVDIMKRTVRKTYGILIECWWLSYGNDSPVITARRNSEKLRHHTYLVQCDICQCSTSHWEAHHLLRLQSEKGLCTVHFPCLSRLTNDVHQVLDLRETHVRSSTVRKSKKTQSQAFSYVSIISTVISHVIAFIFLESNFYLSLLLFSDITRAINPKNVIKFSQQCWGDVSTKNSSWDGLAAGAWRKSSPRI